MYDVPVKRSRAAALALATFLSLASVASAQVTSPEAHFGFRIGADRQLASAESIERYFELVASQSDRVSIVDLGATTEGHRTIAAIISAPENIDNLDRIREVNERLADPRTLTPEEARSLAASHKVVLAIGTSIHASEVGGSQAANELLYGLASAADRATLDVLQNVVIILIPSLNPDGHRLVVDWYNRTKGTSFEGGPMPWLYHKYAGHDINRDGFMMNLAENRNLSRFLLTRWHPQVFLTIHQMEENGPRFFVPPNTDPIDLNYDPLIWRSAALLGSAMAMELQREGKTGVVSNAKYDYYWPGFEDSVPLGHNTICLLAEVASARIASPVTVTPSELRAGFKGLADYQPQINFPDPWPGGRWTLRDIVDYELTAVRGLLFAASAYRETLIQNFYDMGRRAVERGRRGGPFAFVMPAEQHDPDAKARLERLLLDGAVEIHRALEPFRAGGDTYQEGTNIIFMAQPYRAYVKTLIERQRYQARRLGPDGPWERPYDVAGWSLPDQMGVRVIGIEQPFEAPPTARVMEASVNPKKVWGERRPGYWILEAPGNSGALAVNRLVAAGATPSWTTKALEVSGFRYPPGSLTVPYAKAAEPLVARMATELGLRADGARGKVPAGGSAVGRSRIGLYKPWTESIDEGWTRWLLERYEFPFTGLRDAEIRAGDLRSRYDAIVLPNMASDRLTSGYPADVVPQEYAGGLGAAGIESLRAFVVAGGTLICLGQSSPFAIVAFGLPLRDVARDDSRVFVPGSILRLDLDGSHPLSYGMPEQTAAFFAFSSAFEMTDPATPSAGQAGSGPVSTLETVGRYGRSDLLLSGWLEGESVIAGRAAVVRAAVGAGHVVLLGFPVQHRGQSHATFRLLFNALLSAHQGLVPPLPVDVAPSRVNRRIP